MRVVALVSGGKDSCYSMQLCKQHGHDIVALANLLPEETAPDELDSFCFQTVGHQLVGAYSACMGLPLFRKRIAGTSTVQDLGYSPTDGDEVEDLYQLLAYVKESIPGVQAVASGAIASDYQRLRVENVCSRLNLVSLAYLWHQPQRLLLRGMVDSGVHAILVKVACLGLQPRKHLGRTLAAMEPTLLTLADAYGCNVCGEGGEYETMTLDCPVFSRGRIELEDHEIVHGTADVGHLVPRTFKVVPKQGWEGLELPSDVRYVPHDYVPAAAGHRGFGRGGGCGNISTTAAAAAPPPSSAAAAAAGGVSPFTSAGAVQSAPSAGSVPSGPPLATSSNNNNSSHSLSDASLLQCVAPAAFGVQISLCSGPDYVQLVCRAMRTRSALGSDVTECDTTTALHALLNVAEQELAALHMDLHHCLFVHLFLANMGHFQAANGVYCKHFPGRDPPSRACVQVSLPQDCPVMCEFLLARGAAPPFTRATSLTAQLPQPPPPTSPTPPPRHSRRVLHVQSISSWAPSCIGPYSQAISYRGLVFLAGVIPLDPPMMTLVPGDIPAQVLRAMTSCEAVAIAQRTTVVGAALGLTVYLTGGSGSGGGGGVGGGSSGGAGGSGAELRALTRSAVEALLEHGLPGYPSCQPRQSLHPALTASSRNLYHRAATCESASGLSTTPRGHTSPGMGAFMLGAPTSGATAGSLGSLYWGLTGLGLGGSGSCYGAHGGGPGMVMSAPGSRRAVLLGADGLDEEEEEQQQAAAAAVAAGGVGGGGAAPGVGGVARGTTLNGALGGMGLAPGGPSAVVLDSYLQPPEVRSSVRPSVLYVTVPGLPRGSLVEIQPVCLDVEALAVLRKQTGHESFVKRRTNSHHDAASMQSSGAHHHHHNPNHHSQHNNLGSSILPAAAPSPSAAAASTLSTWSELPPTPRASLDSREGSSGGAGIGGCSLAATVTHGSAAHWNHQLSAGDATLAAAAALHPLPLSLPSHMLSASGFMSPDAGSAVGTPNGGLSWLSKQRNSATGHQHPACLSLPPAPPSAQSSAHQLLSPTLQQLLQMPLPMVSAHAASAQELPLSAPQLALPTIVSPPAQEAKQQHPQPQHPQQQPPPLLQPQGSVGREVRRRFSSSSSTGGAIIGTGSGGGGSGKGIEALAASLAAARSSLSGGSGSSSCSSGPMPLPLPHRSSLDGNILSFEVCSGRGGPMHAGGTMSSPPLLPGSALPSPGISPAAPSGAATAAGGGIGGVGVGSGPASGGSYAAGGGIGTGNGTGILARARPAAITVPPGLSPTGPPFAAAAMQHHSPFENGGVVTVAAAVEAAPTAFGLPPFRSGPAQTLRVPPMPTLSGHVHPPSTSIAAAAGGGAATSPIQAPSAQPSVAVPPSNGNVTANGNGTTKAPGGAASSDVMVTTVCCYGQVLRSLFHLPPAVFTPGVTTAQLTRRFRRAAASVLAAHGMDMSCLIWVRVWYDKRAVTLTDDEYGYCLLPPASGTAANGTAGSGGAAAQSAPVVQHAIDMDDSAFEVSGSGAATVNGGEAVPASSVPAAVAGPASRLIHRRSGSGDFCSSGGGGPSSLGPSSLGAGTTAHGLSSGSSSCASPRLSSAARVHASSSPGGGPASPSASHHRLSSSSPITSPNDLATTVDTIPDNQTNHHNHQPHSQQHQHNPGDRGNGSKLHDPPSATPTAPTMPSTAAANAAPQQHFHVSWVPVQCVATNANPQPAACVAVLELLAALPTP